MKRKREPHVTAQRSQRKHLRFTCVGPVMPKSIEARLTPIDPGFSEA